MIKRPHGLDYATYLRGDGWKCASSPTGAHHWIVGKQEAVCKYCQVNNAPKSPDAATGAQPPAP